MRDGVYDPSHWDEQAGCVALIKELAALEPAVAARLTHREAAPPAEVHDAATKRERVARPPRSLRSGPAPRLCRRPLHRRADRALSPRITPSPLVPSPRFAGSGRNGDAARWSG